MAKTKESHKRWVAKNYKKYRDITNRCKRDWDLRNPDKVRIYRQRYRRTHDLHYYSITEEVYQHLYKIQDGKCAICKSKVNDKRLSVDHDHLDGEVRGLLCSACNMGLGLFRDNPESLIKASEYLIRRKRHG